MKNLSILCVLLFAFSANAHEWSEHQRIIVDTEQAVTKFEHELDELVQRKNNTRDRARQDEAVQRIVEIHAELISLRRTMDMERSHLLIEHPDKSHIIDAYDSRVKKSKKTRKKYQTSRLSKQLDALLLMVQTKFSSFMVNEDNEELAEVEEIIHKKRKQKREREADVYLRKRSKVKLVK